MLLFDFILNIFALSQHLMQNLNIIYKLLIKIGGIQFDFIISISPIKYLLI